MRLVLLTAASLLALLLWLKFGMGSAPAPSVSSLESVDEETLVPERDGAEGTPPPSELMGLDAAADVEAHSGHRVEESTPEAPHESTLEGEANARLDCPPDRARMTVVVQRRGLPVSGVEISLDRASAGFEGVGDAKGATDQQGRAWFMVAPMRMAVVTAAAAEFGWSIRRSASTGRAQKERVVTLDIGVTNGPNSVEVVVVDEQTGAPISGALVRGFGRQGGERYETQSDAAGRVSGPLRDQRSITAEAERYGSRSMKIDKDKVGSTVFLELRENARVSGRITTSHDAALNSKDRRSWVEVRLALPRPSDEANSLRRESAALFDLSHSLIRMDCRTAAAPDGSWSMDNVRLRSAGTTGGIAVQVLDRSSGGLHVRTLTRSLSLSPGAAVEVIDDYAGAPSWRIVFRYASSGDRLGSDVRLALRSTTSDEVVQCVTDPNGAVQFRAFPVGEWTYVMETPLGGAAIEGALKHARPEAGSEDVSYADIEEFDRIEFAVRDPDPETTAKMLGPHGSKIRSVMITSGTTGRKVAFVATMDEGARIELVPQGSAITMQATTRPGDVPSLDVGYRPWTRLLRNPVIDDSHGQPIGDAITVKAGDTDVVIDVER